MATTEATDSSAKSIRDHILCVRLSNRSFEHKQHSCDSASSLSCVSLRSSIITCVSKREQNLLLWVGVTGQCCVRGQWEGLGGMSGGASPSATGGGGGGGWRMED